MIRLNKGTKENIIIDVTDQLNNLTTLDGAGAQYSIVTDDDTETEIESDLNAANINMSAYCMIDTTQVEYVIGPYRLYLRFNAISEIPLLGPVLFTVEDSGIS